MKLAKGEGCIPTANELKEGTKNSLREVLNTAKLLNESISLNNCHCCGVADIFINDIDNLFKQKTIRVGDVRIPSESILTKLCNKCDTNRQAKYLHKHLLSCLKRFYQLSRRDGDISFWQELKTWFRPNFIWFTLFPLWCRKLFCYTLALISALFLSLLLFIVCHKAIHVCSDKILHYDLKDDSNVIADLFCFSIAYITWLVKNLGSKIFKFITILVEKNKFGPFYDEVIKRRKVK